MRTKDKVQGKIYVLTCLLGCIMLTGCSGKDVQVTITDGNTETKVMMAAGETVKEALKRAEIQVSEGDVVEPELDAAFTQQNTEVTIARCAKVTVEDGENITELELTGQTVQDVLEQTGITLKEHDYLNHAPEAVLFDGMNITVIRRVEVTVSIDGETRKCLTKATDVESFLAEQNIAVDSKDRISPEKSTALAEGTKITVERVSVKEITEIEPIPFETETEYSNSMYSDEIVEKTPGVEGRKEVTYQVTYVDGKEENRKPVSEKVITEPVSQVVTQGTKERRRIVSKQRVDDCDGSGHGYYVITWSDGTVEYQDF